MDLQNIFFTVVSLCIFTSCNVRTNAQNSPDAPGKNVIFVVFESSDGAYWFGSDGNGVYRSNGKVTTNYSAKEGLYDGHIREIQEDKTGNIFITTLDSVYKFDGKRFMALTVVPGNDTKAWKLQPDDLWFKGRGKGPYRYDGKNLYSLEFPKHEMEDGYYKQFPGTNLSPYEIYYIYKDKKGHIWFGTACFGVYRYDGKKIDNLYEDHLTNVKSNGGSFGIRSVIEDRDGKYWICNSKYRYHILPGELPGKGKGYINYTREEGIKDVTDPLGEDRIYFQSAAIDGRGDMWMQTYRSGIWRYDGKDLKHYTVKDGDKDVKVISMYQDRKGVLWLGTDGGGVFRFDGQAFRKFKF